ncbi:MAG: hypothetical protein IKN69_03835, partial [Bacilli bacterium]|nr:hypothetical protein [Bacilli bacterium]
MVLLFRQIKGLLKDRRNYMMRKRVLNQHKVEIDINRIILLNGPSSSGKSTLSKALRERFAQKSKNYA